SSRRRHTRSTRDWSSDVCSSDLAFCFLASLERRNLPAAQKYAYRVLVDIAAPNRYNNQFHFQGAHMHRVTRLFIAVLIVAAAVRSEERRVGKESRSRGATCQ